LSANCLVRISEASTGLPVDTSDGAFSIATVATLPTIQLSKSTLNFGAVTGGISTPAQSIVVSNSGGGTLAWAAASNQSWLGVTPASGTGTAVVQVSVNPAGLAAGSYAGTITVSDPNAVNSPQTIRVGLTVKAQGTGAVPFGDFATPINGTTGITGAIPVTGWVLDDIETTKVEIWRDPVAGEGTGIVFIGTGIFVEGARPDIETTYPAYPMNYRAGWGYMLLTNFLPVQGNGTYKLHAYATDKEGNTALLGTKTIVCDNSHAVKPFGTIDTPAQGGTVSGNPVINFGWVLTPMPKTVPKDGSTIEVYVDSVKVGNLATAPNVYNQYRVDVSTNFPGFNNTGGPGAGGPVGAFFLDTTKLTNGVHTIYWIATDDAGAADGIGSRYFNVVNMGASPNNSSHCEPLGVAISPHVFSLSPREERSDAAIPTMESLSNLPLSFAPFSVKRGFNLAALPETIIPDDFGFFHIEMREVERIEIDLEIGDGRFERNNPPTPPFRKGGDEGKPTLRRDGIERETADFEGGTDVRYAGYMIVGDELRSLPIGSTLDPFTGMFSWMPGPGFLGTYHLIFLREDGMGLSRRIPVSILIKPKFETPSAIIMNK